MSITQTVDIPDSHRLVIDVPREIPAGPIVLTFTSAKPEPQKIPVFGCSKGKYRMADDFDAPLDVQMTIITADDAKPPNGGVKSIPIGKRPEGAYEDIAKYPVSHIW